MSERKKLNTARSADINLDNTTIIHSNMFLTNVCNTTECLVQSYTNKYNDVENGNKILCP